MASRLAKSQLMDMATHVSRVCIEEVAIEVGNGFSVGIIGLMKQAYVLVWQKVNSWTWLLMSLEYVLRKWLLKLVMVSV
jgi:hypothetical protein